MKRHDAKHGVGNGVRRMAGVLVAMLCFSMLLTGCVNNAPAKEQQNETQQQATQQEATPQQAAQPTQAAPTLQQITVGEVAHSIFYAPSYAAMSLGYFEEEGLDIDLVNLQGADKVMTALITDEIQIGLAGPEEPYQLRKQ